MITFLNLWWLTFWLWRPVAASAAPTVPDLVRLRHLYAEAVQTEAAAKVYHAQLHGYTGNDPAILAYRGVAEALLARYQWSPMAKLRAVREAQRLFTRAVGLAPDNVEVRFLRYTVEANVPRYLGFSQHLTEDRAHIIKGARHYPNLGLDPQSLRLIRDFMLSHGSCTPEEAAMLRRVSP